MKIFEIFEIGKNEIFISKFFIENCMEMKIEKFRSQKISDANFKLSYFFLKSAELFVFFMDPSKIVWKDRKSIRELR